MSYIARLCADLDISLPPIAARGLYKPVLRVGNMLYLSGQVSRTETGVMSGPARAEDLDEARTAARLAATRALSALDAALGPDERIQMVKLIVYVMSTPDFSEHAAVADGASALFAEVLGESGAHARTAIGVASLPSNGLVELDLVAAVTGA